MIRAVISDLGRVVLWFDNNIFLGKLAALAGRTFEEVKAAVHGRLELIRRFDLGRLTADDFRRAVCAAAGADLDHEAFYAIYNDIFVLNPPAVDVLRRIHEANYRTALLSNTDPERFGFVRKRFPEILFFDDYVLSYELGLVKPDRAIYLEAARRAGCRPDECVFIDDMEEN
ncbi:MAG TPA: HAD family phosphatase, partial [Burkholderiales bacterium]|nr:HAD family phosphatase [Burkholderiales bacterium]